MKLASLERIERLLVRAAATTAALLTVVLVLGVIDMLIRTEHHTSWFDSKIVLGIVAWIAYLIIPWIYADGRWRGKPVAWLAVIGLLLVIAAMSAAVAAGSTVSHSAKSASSGDAAAKPALTSTSDGRMVS